MPQADERERTSESDRPPFSIDDVYIPIMGMTGAGKSHFISLCTGEDSCLTVGQGLSSCTSRVSVHSLDLDGQRIHLIDTPGFDDTSRSDVETLQEIAFWLTKAYQWDFRISGLIYLHRITDPRLQGSALRGLAAFKRLCGEDNYPGIVLATTRWDDVPEDQHEKAKRRYVELCEKEMFWKDMKTSGSQTISLSAGRTDALKVLRYIVKRRQRLILAFQRQLLEQCRPIHLTDAGQVLYQAVLQRQQELRDQMAEARRELNSVLQTHHENRGKELQETMSKISADLEEREQDVRSMQEDFVSLERTWEQKMSAESDTIQQLERDLEQEHRHNPVQLESLCDTRHCTENSEQPQPGVESARGSSRSYVSSTTTPFSGRTMGEARLPARHAFPSHATRTSYSRITTLTSVIGAGLAAGQLVAAIACTVM